jgi:hypothetical protein
LNVHDFPPAIGVAPNKNAGIWLLFEPRFDQATAIRAVNCVHFRRKFRQFEDKAAESAATAQSVHSKLGKRRPADRKMLGIDMSPALSALADEAVEDVKVAISSRSVAVVPIQHPTLLLPILLEAISSDAARRHLPARPIK